jgi:adenosine deaminase
VTRAYLVRAATANNVRYAELQWGPQEHICRGVPLATQVAGMTRAMRECAASHGIYSALICDLLKDSDLADSSAVLEEVISCAGMGVVAVGLAAQELGQPPAKFASLMARAVEAGLIPISHTGEEGGPEYVIQTLDALRVRRIDHGVRALEDPALCARLAEARIGLCVCPLSNWRLRIYQRFCGGKNPLRGLLDAGLHVTLNSDDPAFFGGYLNANFERAAADCDLSLGDLIALARNSFEQAFVDHPTFAAMYAGVPLSPALAAVGAPSDGTPLSLGARLRAAAEAELDALVAEVAEAAAVAGAGKGDSAQGAAAQP